MFNNSSNSAAEGTRPFLSSGTGATRKKKGKLAPKVKLQTEWSQAEMKISRHREIKSVHAVGVC